MSRHPERRSAHSSVPVSTFGVLALALALTLTGCTTPDAGPVASPTASVTPPASPTPDASSPPTGPALVPDGTAEENLPLFTAVIAGIWSTPENVSGRAYIDALVAAGFDKAAMQVTNDQTTIGNAAESIQFSVRWDDQCLVGQVGPATGAPVAVVVPALGDGTCLVGKTRPIDW